MEIRKLSCLIHHRFGLWNKSQLAVSLILPLTLLSTACAGIDENAALVTRVIDGDTIEVGGRIKVRYIGIDAPERGEAYYFEASEINRNLVGGERVRLEKDVEDKDKYGRLLRYVWLDDTMVNAELVRLGYAYSFDYPPNVKYQQYFLGLEKVARGQRRGLWRAREGE